MNQMNYEDYVKRVTTKGMRWRAIGQSEDMSRYMRAQATIAAAGRKIGRNEGKLDSKVLITVESLPERPMDVPKLSDLPEELQAMFKDRIGGALAQLAKKKLPAKFLAVEIHPEDMDRDDPRTNVNGQVAANVIGKNLFVPVPDQPDHWRMRHEDNRNAWVEFEFLGAIDMSGFEDKDADEKATSVANDLFARLSDSTPKH